MVRIFSVKDMVWCLFGDTELVLYDYSDNDNVLYRGFYGEYPREYENWSIEDISVVDGVVELTIH